MNEALLTGEARLCLKLMRADTEEQVVDLLKAAGYWDDPGAWRPVNDEENNFATIGNQQSEAVAAFVEKIVNGVDARLVDACIRAGDDPEGPQAPGSMREAVAKYFEHRSAAAAGRIADWTDKQATAEALQLTVAATGNMPAEGQPSLTVADAGEGQTPDRVPLTFMSLQKNNKLRIPFVQGKFNMGGTGALQFCQGVNKLQLIVTRRDPALLPPAATARDRQWSFTVVRREPPRGGVRSSVYTYLAPVGAVVGTNGGVLAFDADTWPIFPEANDKVRDAYYRHASYGSLVKLYEYEWRGTKSNIVSSGDGLLRRIDVALPELPLPVRLYECRQAYRGHAASFATNATGLVARLERDRANNTEEGSPIGAGITLRGKQIPLRIYAFLPGKASQYRTSRFGVVFSLNGQMHGALPTDFFRRKSVGMSYLADSLLVVADCSAIDGQMREDLFMNSRDRLRDGALAHELEEKLEAVLHDDPTLRALKNRRREEALRERLDDDKPLTQLLQSLIKSNPMLSKLLLPGMQLSQPFPPPGGGGAPKSADKFVGKRYPTFFRFRNKHDGEALERFAKFGSFARIAFETDAEDSYFVREDDPGVWNVRRRDADGSYVDAIDWSWTGPKSGVAHMSIDLPAEAAVGEEVSFLIEVTDPSRIDAFELEVTLKVQAEGSSGSTGGSGAPNPKPNEGRGDASNTGSMLALPEVTPVHRDEYQHHSPPFTEETALRIKDAGSEPGDPTRYDFFINVDNKYLRILQKESRSDATLLEKQFTYGLVLVGLALLQDIERHRDAQDPVDAENLVGQVTRAIGPFLLPIIQSIGTLGVEDL